MGREMSWERGERGELGAWGERRVEGLGQGARWVWHVPKWLIAWRMLSARREAGALALVSPAYSLHSQ